MKCITKDCENYSYQGRFVCGLCAPSQTDEQAPHDAQRMTDEQLDAPFLPNWANYRQGVADGRDEALEEAASICETAPISFDIEVWRSSTKQDMTMRMVVALARAIRALKGDEK